MKFHHHPLPYLAALTLGLLAMPGTTYSADEEPPCCKEKQAATDAEGSIYDLDAVWTNQHGKELKLANLKGQPVLLTIGYASCQFACPRLVADLMAIERGLTESERKQVAIVFVSIDPTNDTPEKLGEFFKQYHVDQSRWSGLRGDSGDVLELSVALGARYRKLENGDFAHSNLITLIDADGSIVHRQEGLGIAPNATIKALRGILPNPTDTNAKP
ncbi:SCO family protein [Haloferula rosea]|uniref:SCO family protein n=1 Tax=Haloferula rosea TaxID=490093 RepID=A0A934VH68_9BACT|nr:SCO family protein [Haloferula rosea]MBK1828766.1 SCO family protein [Haloferula rosea]